VSRLQGKTALITGSARGIGKAFANAYVQQGAKVCIADINLEAATKTAQEIGKSAIAVHMDVTDQNSIDSAVDETVKKLKCIDILINNAALISLTQSAGMDLIKHGINVNAISPGVVDGEHWDGVDAFFAEFENKVPGQKKKEVGEAVPFGRMGVAEDLTGMAVFLASSDADYVVAQTYNVDGGQWMS